MAKKVAKKVTKKRVKKNVERGQAQKNVSRKTLNEDKHTSSHLLTIQLLHLQILRVMLFHGQVQAVWDLEVQGNLLHMQRRWQLRQQLRQH